MANLIIVAHLFSEDDKPIPNHAAKVETFDLSNRQWRAIAEAKTSPQGQINIRIDTRQVSMGKVGPALRLVEEGSPARVLSPGAMLGFQANTGDILADFGQIERLDDAAFARQSSGGAAADMVAGVARKGGMSQTMIIRKIGSDPELGLRLARDGLRVADTVLERETAPTGKVATNELDPKVVTEIQTLHAINLNNTAKLSEKDLIIATRDHELNLKATELQTALDRASLAEAKLAQAEVANKGTEADIQNVVTNIGTKIGTAAQTLKTAQNPFRIGAIRVDLKGALADQGKIFLGGTKPDGSGVSVEMTPDGGTRSGTEVTVPDVTGFTQTAARRVLRSIGLRLKLASQTAKPGAGVAHGQSIRQSPAAGSTLPHGSDVLVVFAIVPEE